MNPVEDIEKGKPLGDFGNFRYLLHNSTFPGSCSLGVIHNIPSIGVYRRTDPNKKATLPKKEDHENFVIALKSRIENNPFVGGASGPPGLQLIALIEGQHHSWEKGLKEAGFELLAAFESYSHGKDKPPSHMYLWGFFNGKKLPIIE